MTRLLTPARMRYAWIAGAALWGGWLLSLLGGSGGLDLAGQVIGTDYLEFYAAGWMIRHGQAARLYDPEAQLAAERAILGPSLPAYHAFLNPPFLALLFVPLSLLPYPVSFALWSAMQLLLLALSLRALSPPQRLREGHGVVPHLPPGVRLRQLRAERAPQLGPPHRGLDHVAAEPIAGRRGPLRPAAV